MTKAGPWEDYADPAPAATPAPGPWNDYADPTPPPAAAAAAATPTESPGLDWTDIGKGAVGGLGRGTAGVLGAGGSIGEATRAGLQWAGVPDRLIDTAAAVTRHLPGMRIFSGPDPAQIRQLLEPYTGKFYEPKTTAGQYASTAAEFAPAALFPGGGGAAARVLNTVVPAVVSETAGQATKGTSYEPYARAAGGLLGGPLGAKLITPAAPASAARAADVATLEAAGVPLTAGQRTGSRPLQWFESTAADMPFVGPAAQRLADRASTGYDTALTNRIFSRPALTARGVPPEAALPGADVAAAGRQSISDEFDRITANNTLRADPQLMQEQQRTLAAYEGGALPSQRAGGSRDLAAIHSDILDHLIANNGGMAGDVYQQTRSRLGTLARGSQAGDPYLADALTQTRNSLDAAMARSMSPDDAAALIDAQRRWALMKQTESAVSRAGEHLSPAGVAQAVRAGRAGQYNQNAGALDELVRAGANVLKPLPNSGTAQRSAAQALYNIPSALAHAGPLAAGGAMATLFGWPGALAGIAAPYAAARFAVSRPGQAWLGNRVLPQNMRDVMAQTVAQQAGALPLAITDNTEARAEYDRRRADELRRQGLQ